ncbi:MAG: SPOR domain-containing protein, partial [Bacteroidia bacterium]|nr:SPOR domain-containing protein [Bacteroidia bacterium]
NASKTKFRSSFPEYANRTYSLYQQPYWKIRVGDFYREIDAQKLLAEVRVKFPNAFVVRDYIKRPKL